MSSSRPVPGNTSPIQSSCIALRDDILNQWLQDRLSEKHIVALVHAGHLCKFFDVNNNATPLHLADPDKQSAKTLKKLAKAGLLKRLELPIDELRQVRTVCATWSLLDATDTDVSEWIKRRADQFERGRGKAISDRTAQQVWHDAGGRCMYRGCCEDLGITPLTTQSGRTGYLAHIIASDPDGPRGDSATSHALSDEPENIMLMCDAHHRLIDRLDADSHPPERLQEMRRERSRMVRIALDGVGYPRTQVVTLFGDIANISTVMSERDMRKALLERRLSMLPDIFHAVHRTQRDIRVSTDFWDRLLHEHEQDVRNLVLSCRSHRSITVASAPEVLAVFPLHLVPVLILAGRIVGEARQVEVFQYDRHRQTWRWDASAFPQPSGFFQRNPISDAYAEEVLLTLELTATIDERALPEPLASRVNNGSMPWVRITATNPNAGCIRHPDDLVQFTDVARNAIRLIQDGIRPKIVHVIGVSPASTLFRFGQLLQAGHHVVYNVYDRPDHTRPFTPGLSIDGQQVFAATWSGNSDRCILNLR